MLKDVELNGTIVTCTKRLYADNEITLAQCLLFDMSRFESHGEILIDLRHTARKALDEFLKECFRNFMENPANQHYKDDFFTKVKDVYRDLYIEFHNTYLVKAGYQDILYKHQKEGLFIANSKRCNFFAFEQGTGKSKTAATISKINNIRRTLIVCPSLVKWNWLEDLTDPKTTSFNQLYFSIYDTSKKRTLKAFQERFVIVNFEMLHKFHDEIVKGGDIGHIIIDESQKIKNQNSRNFKSIQAMVNEFPNTRISFLSGTPITNRVNDAFAYLKLTGHPLGENYSKFLRDYTTSVSARNKIKITGARNLNDLFIKMSNFMIRKTKAECLDIPDKIYYRYRFELDDYRDEYNKVIEEMLLQKDRKSIDSSIHTLNIILCKAKLKGYIEIAEDILEQGRKPVIFCSYKEPLYLLQEHFKGKCVLIDGSVASHKRMELVNQFKNDDNTTVFLGNMQAAGVGINLTNSSDVIICNFPMVPTDLYQAEDRTHRIGQKNQVNIYYTLCEDSIDEYLYELVSSKAADINALIDRGKEISDFTSVQESLFKHILKINGKSEFQPTDSDESINEGGVLSIDSPGPEVSHIEET